MITCLFCLVAQSAGEMAGELSAVLKVAFCTWGTNEVPIGWELSLQLRSNT